MVYAGCYGGYISRHDHRTGEALMRLFRERLLARLVEKHAISQELA